MTILRERDRRWTLLQSRMREEGLDGLIVGTSDYRGVKGGLRYVTDYRAFHRFGYAVLPAQGEAALFLPSILELGQRSPWIDEYHFSDRPGATLGGWLAARKMLNVGFVAQDDVVRIADLEAIRAAAPGLSCRPADALFEQVRSIKSAVEISGLEEASHIADRCFDRVLSLARPGRTEREINAEVTALALAMGADELLFLSMFTEAGSGRPRIDAPGGREITATDPFIFSIELTGPAGYWVELARMIVFAGKASGACEAADWCHASVRAAREILVPGVSGLALQEALERGAAPSDFQLSGWSGHGIGQDVIEKPLIGRGVSADTSIFKAGMALAFHPFMHRPEGPVGYVADTYVMTDRGHEVLSRWPLETYALPRG